MSGHLQGDATSDEHATLDAALAFVDEYELTDFETDANGSHHGLLLDSSDYDLGGEPLLGRLSLLDATPVETKPSIIPQTESPPPAPAPPAKRSSTNRSRTRQKDELVYLRGVVEELEDQLSTLKKGGDDGAAGSKTEASEPLAFVWEELAARQYAQRQRAEVENVKLRTMLEEQIRVAKNLERLLKKRTMAEFLVPPSVKRVRKWKGSSALDDPQLFDELMRTVDEMLTKVDDVFADERFACKTPALREIQARNDEEFGTVVEVFDSRVGPFDVHKVSDAVWHHMAVQAFDPNAFHDEIVELTDTTLKREFGSVVDMPRFKGTFRGKITARRVIEDDRVILLWSALLDPEKVSDMPMDGLVMRQRGWTLMRRPPAEFIRADRPAVVTQSYHMIIPELDEDEEGDQRRKVGTLTNFVLSSVDFHLEMGRQMIENLLLEDGWKTPTTNSPEAAVVATTPSGEVW